MGADEDFDWAVTGNGTEGVFWESGRKWDGENVVMKYCTEGNVPSFCTSTIIHDTKATRHMPSNTSRLYPCYTVPGTKSYTSLPPPQVPRESQLLDLLWKRRRNLGQSWSRNRISQVHSGANLVIDLQISRNERKCTHIWPRAPRRSVWLRRIMYLFLDLRHP